MRFFLALAGAALTALPVLVSANQPQYSNQRPPPPFPDCPDFFSTTVTTNVSNPSFGPLTNSIHYQLTAQRINYGRNTYIQMRFYSNLQDTPLKDVKVCMAAAAWTPNTTDFKYRPVFKNRVKYSPRIRGTQPTIEAIPTPIPSQYIPSGFPYAFGYCVIVPYIKPKGRQKVDFLWYTDPCTISTDFRGWASFPNPYKAPGVETCDAASPPTTASNSNTKYAVRSLVSTNKDMSPTCPTYPWGK